MVRSLESHVTYFERWARMWERQSMMRARFVAGDAKLGQALLDALAPAVWGPVSDEDRREMRRMKARIEAERVPVNDDPAFHLKLGPGAMADVEFCTQMLQLDRGVRDTGTLAALATMSEDGLLSDDTEVLAEAYRFCESTRNRWFLVKGGRADSIPQGLGLATLARSLGTTGPDLRDRYRQVTRRARRVVEQRFYGGLEG